MNIGTYINSKDKNAECRVGNTKMQLHRLKKKNHYLQVFCDNQRPIKRDKEAKRGKERSIRSAEERGKKRVRQQGTEAVVERTRGENM